MSKTQISSESLAQVEGDFRRQLELSVPQYEPGEWKDEFKMSSFTTTMLNFALHRSGAKGQGSTFSDVHLTWIGRFECRQAAS